MCGFYDDEQKIKKGDKAIYKEQPITITLAKHITTNKTMDIGYKIDNDEREYMINIPYKTVGFDLQLKERLDSN